MLKLASEGLSQRAIARQAFGNARLHGRVERILRTEQEDKGVRPPSEAPRADGELPTSEELFTRYLRDLDRRLEQGERVSAQEIAAIIRVENMLESKRTFEQLRDLTREQPA